MRWIFLSLLMANLAVFGWYGYQYSMSEPVKETPPPINETLTEGKRLMLLSERKQAQSTSSTQPRIEPIRRCDVVGPYRDNIDARHMNARVQSVGLTGHILNLNKAGTSAQYWVYLEPRPSRAAALKTLKSLQKRKIDSFVITKGELANGISLGVFRSKVSADKLEARMKKLGLDVKAKTANSKEREYWVELEEGSDLHPTLRKRLIGEDKNVAWKYVQCSKKANKNS